MSPETIALIMVACLFVMILAGIPVALAIAGAGLVFGYIGFGETLFSLLPARVFGVITNYTLLAIPLFVFMGVLLEKSRLAEDTLSALGHLAGNRPGGMALAIVLVGVLMGASTGIVGATVVTMGLITLGKLLERGYRSSLACGTICASGTLGQIIPPSLVLILLSDIMGESVGALFAAAVMPSLLLAALYAVYIIAIGRFLPHWAPPVPQAERDALSRRQLLLRVLKSAVPPLALIAVVLGSIISGLAAPTEAAAMGALGALLITVLGRKMNGRVLGETVRDTLKITGMIMFVLIAAQIFALSFRGLDGEYLIEGVFDMLPGGMWGALIFTMAAIFILGFFLEWIEISYIVLPLMLPVFIALQVDMIWFAMLVTLNLQASFLTPPFGWALFFLKGVAPPQVSTREIYAGALPFIGIQLLGLVLVMAFPAIATWLPRNLGW
ncbi:TRAP transporter large permease [Thioalkalivibrio thiocyanodenitrificans]|uniref:TRAP transporter large permease n=1 Tax=Thioalkalivibrio thiocyanodenitrificans TaxID=243063 RepID=UPI0003638A04|nr:TRAP transporter large permease subunit [Thioalkalivibrio thiocyanodenitrificans]